MRTKPITMGLKNHLRYLRHGMIHFKYPTIPIHTPKKVSQEQFNHSAGKNLSYFFANNPFQASNRPIPIWPPVCGLLPLLRVGLRLDKGPVGGGAPGPRPLVFFARNGTSTRENVEGIFLPPKWSLFKTEIC